MKGIVLAGGSGTRLHPITIGTNKQLLPIYDKPTIYYPLSTLMLAGIQDILIISTPRDLPNIKHILKDGSQWGIRLEYAEQDAPRGIAEAYLIGEPFVSGEPSALILGDNIFWGHDLVKLLRNAVQNASQGASVFAYRVTDPERYGVAEISSDGRVLSLEEKPSKPKSSWAVTGLYFYDGKASQYARELKPSNRGELEITDLNRKYLEQGVLRVEQMGRGFSWLDTGTFDSLLESSTFVQTLQKRQGQKIACPEEIAYLMGYIGKKELIQLAKTLDKSGYGAYLRQVAEDDHLNVYKHK